jgi:hypothetical protein
MDDKTKKLYFEKIKEFRDTYFVEYAPPADSFRFAILNLVFYRKTETLNVVDAMEKELKLWITRYRVPLMVFAWDDTESIYDLSKFRPCNQLMGFFDKNKNEICLYWSAVKEDQIPDDALNIEYLKSVNYDVHYETTKEKQTQIDNRRKKIKTSWFIFALWLVVVPVIVAFIDVIIPYWLQVLIFVYCVYKAVLVLLELLGKSKKTQKEKDREEKETKMQHYYYHCEQNPEGFLRLKQENFERMAKELIQKEATELKLKTNP